MQFSTIIPSMLTQDVHVMDLNIDFTHASSHKRKAETLEPAETAAAAKRPRIQDEEKPTPMEADKDAKAAHQLLLELSEREGMPVPPPGKFRAVQAKGAQQVQQAQRPVPAQQAEQASADTAVVFELVLVLAKFPTECYGVFFDESEQLRAGVKHPVDLMAKAAHKAMHALVQTQCSGGRGQSAFFASHLGQILHQGLVHKLKRGAERAKYQDVKQSSALLAASACGGSGVDDGVLSLVREPEGEAPSELQQELHQELRQPLNLEQASLASHWTDWGYFRTGTLVMEHAVQPLHLCMLGEILSAAVLRVTRAEAGMTGLQQVNAGTAAMAGTAGGGAAEDGMPPARFAGPEEVVKEWKCHQQGGVFQAGHRLVVVYS